MSRPQAPFSTEPSVVYAGGCPQHSPGRPGRWLAPPRTRFNNPRRQRVSRWVREALSLAKKRAQPRGAIKRFLCHYNLTRAVAENEHDMDITTGHMASFFFRLHCHKREKTGHIMVEKSEEHFLGLAPCSRRTMTRLSRTRCPQYRDHAHLLQSWQRLPCCFSTISWQ